MTLATGTTTVGGTPHKLTTVIQDPGHPDEPWTIETTQEDGELLTLFIQRHMLAVQAVRKILKGS